jgi:hypothetical protein
MLNTSSFMGSSYTHWTTSLVWEEAYEKLVPNYNNVLPKIYTDGTLVPERNLDNTLSSETLQDLRNNWYEMCNAVRVKKGYPEYTFDEYFEVGEAFFQKEAEKTMKKGETEIHYDFNEAFNPIGMVTRESCINSHIYEWTDTELEYFKGFFEESDCGDGFMSHDYMVIAFMEVGGRLFYSYTTFHNMGTLPDTSESVLPQPESQPVLEINPADNEMPVDQTAEEPENVETEYYEPEITETEEYENTETEYYDPEITETEEYENTETEYYDPEITETEEPEVNSNDGLPAFEDYPEEMKQRMLVYDGFDIGLSGVGNYDDFPYMQWDNAAAYLGWWAGQEFGTEMTGEELKDFVNRAYETGEYNQWTVSEVIADQFGKEMIRDEDGNMYVGDGNIEDPDGEW